MLTIAAPNMKIRVLLDFANAALPARDNNAHAIKAAVWRKYRGQYPCGIVCSKFKYRQSIRPTTFKEVLSTWEM